MIKYWKTEEKAGEWRQTEDDPQTLTDLLTNNVVRHMTVLAVDRPVTKEVPRDVIKYFGDMWFDIDFKPEEVGGTQDDAIAHAIKSCQQLVAKLINVGTNGMQVYASGSKGFHVIVPWQNFGALKPQPFLYDTYRQLAVHFKVDGLDMGVYKGGKGATLRMPNVRRDKGTYKVPLTVDELSLLSPDGYRKLVSNRRIGFVFGLPEKSDSLAALLKMAKVEAAKLRKEREKLSEAAPKEDLAKDYKENGLPGCIERLVTAGDEREGSNFNQACLQFATYCKDAGLDAATVKSLSKQMSESVKSSKFPTPADKYNAILSVVETVKGSNYHFSKGGLFSVVNRCNKCSLCESKKTVQGDVALDIDERLQMAIGRRGYEQGFGRSMSPATNFHLRTKATKVSYPVAWHNAPELRRSLRRPAGLVLDMTVFDSMGASDPIEINMSEEAVNSSMLARDVFVAAGGSWLTSPDFWSKLRMVLTDRGNLKVMNAEEEITVVPCFGVSVFLRDGEPVIVYCDLDTHLLSDPEITEVFRTEFPSDPKRDKLMDSRSRMPNLANVPPFSTKMERGAMNYSVSNLEKLVDSISRTLPDAEAAITLGWFCGAHLKPHLKAIGINYPLMNLYGPPESGKTASASLMLSLHGIPGTGSPVVDASQSTIVSMREKLSQSNSVPTIVDEVNQGTIDYKKYQELVNILKSSWDHNATSKMDGGGIRDTIATSPIITCGEETISAEHRSLRTRTLEVGFDPAWKDDDTRRRHFMYATARKPLLASLGLDLIVEAVQGVSTLWVSDRFMERLDQVPKVMGSDRKREGYAACLMGLDFLDKALTRLGANCKDRLGQLDVALRKHVANIDGVVDTNTDRVIRRIVAGINNYITDIDPDGPKVPPGIGTYFPTANEVRFEPRLAYESMRRTNREDARTVFKLAPEDFSKMLQSAPPSYVDMREDGCAYIQMEDLVAKGWWLSAPSVSVEDF